MYCHVSCPQKCEALFFDISDFSERVDILTDDIESLSEIDDRFSITSDKNIFLCN